MKPFCNVSVLTANYNKSCYLNDYFDSLLASNTLPSEIVFIDDGSTDSSVQIVSKYLERLPIKLVLISENIGFANVLNIGIEKCESKYIMRLDPDDFITEDRIEQQFSFLEQNPHIDVLGSNTFYYNENLRKVIFHSNFPTKHTDIKAFFAKGLIGVSHPSVMIRTDFFKTFRYNQRFFPFEEYDIFSRMLLKGGYFHNQVEYLTFYRQYGQNCSLATIQKKLMGIRELRVKYFHNDTPKLLIMIRVFHVFFYRKGLSSSSILSKNLFLLLSTFFSPSRFIKRFFT